MWELVKNNKVTLAYIVLSCILTPNIKVIDMTDRKRVITIRASELAYDNLDALAAKDDRTMSYAANKVLEGLTKPAKKPAEGKAARKTRIPADFALTRERINRASVYWASHSRRDLNVEDEFAEFKNHYLASGDTWLDWDKVWNKWYARAIKFNKPPARGGSNGNHKQSDAERISGQAQGLFSTDHQREDGSTLMDENGQVIS